MSSIFHVDVCDLDGSPEPIRGSIVILSGDAPMCEYFSAFFHVFNFSPSVIAIAPGIDVKREANQSIVIFSTRNPYAIGKTLEFADAKIRGEFREIVNSQ